MLSTEILPSATATAVKAVANPCHTGVIKWNLNLFISLDFSIP